MEQVIEYIRSYPASAKALIISIITLMIFCTIYAFVHDAIVKTTNLYSNSIVGGDSIRRLDMPIMAIYLTTHLDSSDSFKRKIKTLANQYTIIAYQRRAALNMAQKYYDLYYTQTTVLTVATILTAISVFLIANAGWSNANYKLKTVFFTLFFISSVLGAFISTLNLKDNFENNFNQDFNYLKLEDKIYTFVNSCDTIPAAKRDLIFTRFIGDINSDIDANCKFAIDIKFDMSYAEIYKDLNNKIPGTK